MVIFYSLQYRQQFFGRFSVVSILLTSIIIDFLLRSISNFNYKYTTISNHGMNAEMSNLVTDKNLSTIAKWESIALSKSCVGINLLFPKNHSLNCQYYIDNYNM